LTDFLSAYGPDGSWVQLLRQGDGYIRTELLSDCADPVRFVTVDYWESDGAWDEFQARFRAEYVELDIRCDALTTAQSIIGHFHCSEF